MIENIPNWNNLSAEEILSYLTTPLNTRKPEAQATITVKYLLGTFEDPMIVENVIGTLRQIGLNATADALASTGIDFGNPVTQQWLDVLGQQAPQVFTAEIIKTLKSLGVDSRTPWEIEHPGEEPPTLKQIEDEVAKLNLKLWFEARSAYIASQISMGNLKTQEEVTEAL